MIFPIADLHCDLLCYLQKDKKRSPYDIRSRCSFSCMKKGGVTIQVLPIFSQTQKGSTLLGKEQFIIFEKLFTDYFKDVKQLTGITREEERIHFALAIENASSFFEEDEDLELGFKRLEEVIARVSPVIYMSLTWNTENRFGGGAHSKVGLKNDGKLLIEFLDRFGISIDLSHTSDALAFDILNWIDSKKLSIIPIASHSNFRNVHPALRNLPDELAAEIIKRKGVIGLNFVRKFLGDEAHQAFLRQVEHAFSIGARNHLCFGADFFFDDDLATVLSDLNPVFFNEFGTPACYPELLILLQTILNEGEIKKISSENLLEFIERVHISQTFKHSILTKTKTK